MKLALSLVFVAFNVQLISCFLSPYMFMQLANPYGGLLQADPRYSNGIQNGQPIVLENSGVDQDGNPYYEKEVIQSFQKQIPMLSYGVNPVYYQLQHNQAEQQIPEIQQEMKMRIREEKNPFGSLLGSIMDDLEQQQVMSQHHPRLWFHLANSNNAKQENVKMMKNSVEQQGLEQQGLAQEHEQKWLQQWLRQQQQQQQEQQPQQGQEQQQEQDDQFKNGVNNIFDGLFEAENQILGSFESEDQNKEALEQQEAGRVQEQLTLNRNLLKNKQESQEEPKITSLEILTPQSAIDFEKNVKPHAVPKVGQFHLRQPKYEHVPNQHDLDDSLRKLRTQQARKIEHQKFDFLLKPIDGENAVELLVKKDNVPETIVSDVQSMKNNDDLKGDENSVEQIELQKAVDAKEKSYLQRVKAEAQGLRWLTPEDMTSSVYLKLSDKVTESGADRLLNSISEVALWPAGSVKDVRSSDNLLVFNVDRVLAKNICEILESSHQTVFEANGLKLVSCSFESPHSYDKNKVLFIVTVIVCISVLCVLIGLIGVFFIKRRDYLRQKLIENVSNLKPSKGKFDDIERLVNDQSSGNKLRNKVWPFKTKQVSPQQADLCRSANLSPLSDTQTTVLTNRTENFESTPVTVDERKVSARSSASSWSDEPVSNTNIDITTGHAILAYMEEHLNEKSRLDIEWVDLCGYEADLNDTFSAKAEENIAKNRYSNILPYDHNRVKLYSVKEGETDYINASYITDDDPKNPTYIATQGPLLHTTSDFWKMIWEQNSVIIVSLCRTVEYGSSKCNQYWPVNGFERYGEYEVHLVSEHVWCEDYLVRSFYLMNKALNQTRTVTQFQFLSWPETSMPPSIKSLLDFRRKVNKSYNKKSFPIIVHCNDGIGRTGTYIMIDMVLNKVVKEAKEIDLAATLEYLRDQRKDMVKNKNQFEFSFAAVTEEVQNMLKTVIQ